MGLSGQVRSCPHICLLCDVLWRRRSTAHLHVLPACSEGCKAQPECTCHGALNDSYQTMTQQTLTLTQSAACRQSSQGMLWHHQILQRLSEGSSLQQPGLPVPPSAG